MPFSLNNKTNTKTSASSNRKYFLGFIMFIFFVITFDRGLFYLIRVLETSQTQKKEFNKIFYQKRDFNKNFLNIPPGTYNTLIMGSSRTRRGIHPFYLYQRLKQNAFKIARGKTGIKFNYYFYQEYKKYAGVPEVVIYGLDYFMFNAQSDAFLLSAVCPREQLEDRYASGPLLLLSNKIQTDSLITNMLEQWNERLKPDRPVSATLSVIDPFVGYGKTQSLDRRKPRQFVMFDYVKYPGREGVYFTKLLEQWEADGVRVVLVFLPDYIGTYESNYQVDLFKQEIGRLASSYQEVFLYDYSHPRVFPLSEASYFLDGAYGKTNSHLSLEGARELNRRLIRDVRRHYR